MLLVILRHNVRLEFLEAINDVRQSMTISFDLTGQCFLLCSAVSTLIFFLLGHF